MERTFPVPDVFADRCPVILLGVSWNALAVVPRTIPEVATWTSVAMFGTTSGTPVVEVLDSTSTWAVEA
jgi:hypothetical protein